MRSDLFSPQNAEAQMQQPGMKWQNGKMLKIALNGEMMVRQGAMVAYQGKIQFQGQGADGIGKFVKQQLTGEGVPLMKCTGAGMLSNAGLFNCVFSGQGRIAITTKGTPVVLNVDQPTYADPQAAVCWSSSLQTGFHSAEQFGLGTLIGRTTGEAFTMSFSGQGFVVVQPSEEVPASFVGGSGGGQQAGSAAGNILGGFLGR